MSITELCYDSFYCYILLTEKQYLVFPQARSLSSLRFLAIQTVLDMVASLGLDSDQIDWLLPEVLCCYCTSYLAGKQSMQIPWFVTVLAFIFLLWQCENTFQYHKQSEGVKSLGRHQLNFSVFTKICRFLSSTIASAVSVGRATNSIGYNFCCMIVSMGHL